MPQLFCRFCQNLLTPNYTDNILKFNCITCKTSYEATESDSLRYEEVKESNILIHSRLLDKIHEDPAALKQRKACPKCKYNIVKQVRIGEDLRSINTCLKCKYQFI